MTTEQKDVAALAKDGNKVIRNHMLVSMAVGLIPIPMADIVGITAVQLNMLRKLAKIHEIPFTRNKVKSVLTSLVGGGGSVPVAGGFASLVKAVPVVGTTVGAVSMPIVAGAVTYAVGKVFLQHFASGGTFLTFDPEKVREYYSEMFKEGKTAASDMAS
jgi:uncharacterized protein (DUF697 family)